MAYEKKSRAHEIMEKKKTITEIKMSCARDNRIEKTIYEIKKSCAGDKRKEKTIYEIKKSRAHEIIEKKKRSTK